MGGSTSLAEVTRNMKGKSLLSTIVYHSASGLQMQCDLQSLTAVAMLSLYDGLCTLELQVIMITLQFKLIK